MPWTAPAGDEWVGVTFTVVEKVGFKVLAMRTASRRLNLSDHFWSSSAIFISVVDLLSAGFTDLSVLNFPFLW